MENKILLKRVEYDNNGNIICKRIKSDIGLDRIIDIKTDKNDKIIHFTDTSGREYWKERNEDGKVIHFKQICTTKLWDSIEWWKEITEDNGIKVIKYKDSNGLEYTKTKYVDGSSVKEYNNGEVKKRKIINGIDRVIYHKTKDGTIVKEILFNERDLVIEERLRGKTVRKNSYDDKDRIIKTINKNGLVMKKFYSNDDNSYIKEYSNGNIYKYNNNGYLVYEKIYERERIYEYDSENRLVTSEYRLCGKCTEKYKYDDRKNTIYKRSGDIEHYITYNETDDIIRREKYKIVEDK